MLRKKACYSSRCYTSKWSQESSLCPDVYCFSGSFSGLKWVLASRLDDFLSATILSSIECPHRQSRFVILLKHLHFGLYGYCYTVWTVSFHFYSAKTTCLWFLLPIYFLHFYSKAYTFCSSLPWSCLSNWISRPRVDAPLSYFSQTSIAYYADSK